MRKDLDRINLFFFLTIIAISIACVPWSFAAQIYLPGNYSSVADGESDLLISKIDIGTPTEDKGNLILVAGGNINYTAFSQQTKSLLIGIETDQFDHIETKTSYWQITQDLANYVFNKFRISGYEVYDIYYFNPNPIQDTDKDGIPDQSVVDESIPTSEKLQEVIKQFPQDHIENPGPLYIYLIGHGVEDKFLIMPNEIITARQLKDTIEVFQANTNRQVVVIIESSASGSFIDDLAGPDIIVITSTGDRASYIKPIFTDTDTLYNSFTTAFIDVLGPYLDPNTILLGTPDDPASRIITSLKRAFLSARNQLEKWSLSGPPFADQTPQIALPSYRFTSISFSKDGETPVDYISISSITSITSIAENITCFLSLIGKDPNHNFIPIPQDMKITFFSSDKKILDPASIERIIDPSNIENIHKTNISYKIIPKKNGRLTLFAHADPNLLLSAKLTIEVSVKEPGYAADLERMAIIIAGFKGTDDYLWESSNTITNHAYKILRTIGYTKEEICYYNPYLLQDLDENQEYDDIDGYPRLSIFDPNACHDTRCSPFAKIRQSKTNLEELLIFLTDLGIRGKFSLNPATTKSSLTVDYLYSDYLYLIEQINRITDKVNDKIIFLYDACYSGSFISEIEKHQISALSQKFLTITSTNSNQIAYYLNNGIVSFSYPFFNEWYMTHSLTQAFAYAKETLPLTDPNLSEGQTPCISDYSLAQSWDKGTIYYVDESRPVFGEVQANRSRGTLRITANVFSLTGIKDVWAIVENANNSLTSVYGEAITEAILLYLSPRFNDPNTYVYGGDYELTAPDPSPNDDKYNLTIYATDNSKLPKLASYNTIIEDPVQNKTQVRIIASDPGLFPTSEAQQKLHDQVRRAEEILEGKGLSKSFGDILTISGEDINSLDDLSNAFPPAEGRNHFIFLIGYSYLDPNNIPCFYINPNVILTPQQFCSHIPMDPNERLLVLMDAPYAEQFLSGLDQNTLPRNWAGIASTNRGHLFFPFVEGSLFPCFSNFFFSMVLSGATVSHAYRMAENAVSLTWQKPGLFLPGNGIGSQEINRHLNYYLGTSAIQGEDYSLFTECSGRFDTQIGKYHLSLAPKPDANIKHAWAVLTFPLSPSSKDSMIVDLDPNGPLYTADKESSIRYNKAFFLVEGSLEGETNLQTTWSDWEEVHIAQQTITEIEEDPHEPDDDPNSIILDPNHKIIVNASPRIHTFYCKDPKGCQDEDWIYFYAQKGHIYKIYAWDLSENEYLIQLSLYDPNIRPLCEKGVCLISNNKLSFSCNQSGYYLLKTVLASSYPTEGVEFIIRGVDLMTKDRTTFLLKLIDPLKIGIGKKWKINDPRIEDLTPTNYLFIYPDTYYYKFNGLTPGFFITIEVCSDANCNEPIADTSVELLPHFLNPVTMNISDIFDPNIIHDPNDYLYSEIIGEKTSDLEKYPWKDSNFTLYGGDMDRNFPPDGDYDGDKLLNFYEVFACGSQPHYPTFILTLHKGINLYYFPHVDELSSIIPSDPNQVFSYYYISETEQWEQHEEIKSNTFNAIYTLNGGMLSLDLNNPNNSSVFCLKGLMDPNSFPQQQDLNQSEVWSRFIQVDVNTDTNFPTLEWDPNEIASEIGSVALIIEDPNGLILLVDDMSKTSSYQTKKEDAIDYLYLDSVSAPLLFSYAIVNTYYRDGDEDSYGDPNNLKLSIEQSPGYILQSGDCNDTDPNINPAVTEVCDGKDNDCDGSVDEDLTRTTTCGVGECAGNTGSETCSNGVWSGDTCNPLEGAIPEVCDGKDNDCDGVIDPNDSEGCIDYYRDHDNDTYGLDNGNRCLCAPEGEYNADRGGDPDDQDPNVPIEITIDLPADWSMISLPVIPDSKVASHLFPDANVIYRYSKGENYVRVKEAEDMETGKGYWIELDTNLSYSLTGRPIPLNPLSVQENGWDMIGGYTSPVKASVDNGNIVLIYSFVPKFGYKRLHESDCLEPGKGYWILISGISN